MIAYFDTTIVLSLDVAQALIAFASKDTTRPHIGVGVDQGSVCATDGHRAVAFEKGMSLPSLTAAWQGKVWPRAHVETAVKVARAQKADVVRLELEHAKPGFPEVWRVIPDYGMEPRDADPVGVDPAFLADLTKVVKACGAMGVKLSSIRGSLDPIGFTATGADGHTARVVIMPMRIA